MKATFEIVFSERRQAEVALKAVPGDDLGADKLVRRGRSGGLAGKGGRAEAGWRAGKAARPGRANGAGGQEGRPRRTVLHVSLQRRASQAGKGGWALLYIVEADSLASLRARSVSLLRDLKVAADAFRIASG
ncbi:MAG: hypothetical protein V1787_04555 [Candidatus Micrarchaeota archaeon]